MTANAEADLGSPSFYESHRHYHGIFGWIFSTDHRRIGLLTLATVLPCFLWLSASGSRRPIEACAGVYPEPANL